MKDIYWIGMDYHKEKTMLAILRNGEDVILKQHTVDSKPSSIFRVLSKYMENGEVRACYEASCCGYLLVRYLRRQGVVCNVIAPHSIAKSVGSRIKKNDRLDAIQLARQYRNGSLRNVSVPSEKEESVRRYVRLLTELQKEFRRARTRVSFFILQLGKSFDGTNWTKGHRQWLEELELEQLDREVLNERLSLLDVLEQRIEEMKKRAIVLVEEVGGKAIVNRLMCLKGFNFVSAVTVWSELWDATRFNDPRKLMGYWGFDCRESSSGGYEYRGHITKQGNARCRYVLIEAAGSYRNVKGGIKAEWKGQADWVVEYCRKAEVRLSKRYWHLAQTTGSMLKAKVAIARELVGFVWGIMQPEMPV